MDDIALTTTSEDGYETQSDIGDFTLEIDPMEQTGPNPNAVLVADYASCFLPAVRLGARKAGYDDPGQMTIDAEATLDDEDHLEAIEFVLSIEADIEEPDELIERGEELCHVHAALREELHADITVETDAF
ncbi:OsmC family protein [Natronorubrum thiooxidans]|uniref:Organic hydroperoxide reductase OsmC/OhrA n=1 Tax=Natronorubrum thiooxidans TaxID=308853 RepID=A0A1N7HAS2_9EURY|nr:OsmC family protein [Natronorubrum thiooxidans]SIS21975.1 Organic hydroperoxide reductase OsmC/OhrA [Natronorubrum thiooxidans]